MKMAYEFKEASFTTGLSVPLLRQLARDGKLKVARVGRRVLIPASELERLTKPGATFATK